jgi:pyruvate/oxaloacetate carboxyltransferase
LSYALFDQVATKFFENRKTAQKLKDALSDTEAKYFVNIKEIK